MCLHLRLEQGSWLKFDLAPLLFILLPSWQESVAQFPSCQQSTQEVSKSGNEEWGVLCDTDRSPTLELRRCHTAAVHDLQEVLPNASKL